MCSCKGKNGHLFSGQGESIVSKLFLWLWNIQWLVFPTYSDWFLVLPNYSDLLSYRLFKDCLLCSYSPDGLKANWILCNSPPKQDLHNYIQSCPKKFVLGCVIPPAGAVARSRNPGQTFLAYSAVCLKFFFPALSCDGWPLIRRPCLSLQRLSLSLNFETVPDEKSSDFEMRDQLTFRQHVMSIFHNWSKSASN